MANGDRREYTAAGNPRPPSIEVALEWIDQAWRKLSKELIIKSFEGTFVTLLSYAVWILVCALTTPLDGLGDNRIYCFQPDGPIGLKGIDVLRKMRSQQRARDGRDDVEEAGLSDHDETGLNWDLIADEEPFIIE